jgi:hypothetical protein
MELLFNCIQPFIHLKWFFGLFEDRRLSIQKVLEVTELIGFRALTLVSSPSTGSVLRNIEQHLFHSPLAPQKLSHELGFHGWWWWW